MKNLTTTLNRFFAILSIFILLSYGFFIPIINTKVSAAVAWERITNEEFANNWGVFDMVEFNENLYFVPYGTDDSFIFEYNKASDSVSVINGELVENIGIVQVLHIEVASNILYAAFATQEGDLLYQYNGVEWTDITSNIDEEYDYEIHFLGTFNGALIAQFAMDNTEDSYMLLQALSGDNWATIADVDSFNGITNENMLVQEITGMGEGVFARVYDTVLGETGIYQYAGGSDWILLGDIFDDYLYSNLTLFEGALFLTTDDWNTQLTIYFYDWGEQAWSAIDASFGDSSTYFAEIVELDNKLYLGTGNYSIRDAEIYVSEDGYSWSVYSGSIGDGTPVENGDQMAFITEMINYDGRLAVAAARIGEGTYHPILWLESSTEESLEDDDGASTEEENAAPNNGDANNDGILDSEQANVISFVNEITGKYVVLEHTCGITSEISMIDENAAEHKDNAFEYPAGLMNFVIECDYGATAMIKQYYFGDYNAALIVARKYNSFTGTYTTISNSEITNVNIAEEPALLITYEVTDGGELDLDGFENGIIVDPLGPAINSAGVPNTGIGKINK